jgi:hypothetical protein
MNTSTLGILKKSVFAAALTLGVVQAASAGIIFANTAPEAGTFVNARFDRPGGYPGADYAIKATAGTLKAPYIINFKSNEYLTGEVDTQWLRGSDASFKQLAMTVQDSAFTMFSLNLFAPTIKGNPKDRYVDIVAIAFGGQTETYRLNILNGANFFRVNATDDTLLRSLTFASSTDIAYARAIRLGGAQDAPLPEPTTILSLGLGLAGMMAVRRRRQPQ